MFYGKYSRLWKIIKIFHKNIAKTFDYIKYIPHFYSVNNEYSKQTQSINLQTTDIMIAIVNNNAVVINNSTSRRANVIAKRTNSDVMGVVKAQMIDVLKAKLQSGIAHFLFLKKDGSLREAWGTTANNLVKANVNGRGVSRDSVNCVCYWDVEKGGFRSLRFENLVQVF